MRMLRRLAALTLALAWACACEPVSPPKPGSLQKAFEGIPRSPLCSQNLPSDWVSTWPIPTGGKKGAEYKVLFYALDRSAQDASGLPRVRVTEPRGEATFSADGKVSACTSNPTDLKPINSDRYSQAAMELNEEQFDLETLRLLALTEAASGLYARQGASPSKVTLDAYWRQFSRLAEPALLRDYYKASPGFWDWLRRNCGKGLTPG